MEDIKEIEILWDYMKMNHTLKHSDCIIGLGTMDMNVANIVSHMMKRELMRHLRK